MTEETKALRDITMKQEYYELTNSIRSCLKEIEEKESKLEKFKDWKDREVVERERRLCNGYENQSIFTKNNDADLRICHHFLQQSEKEIDELREKLDEMERSKEGYPFDAHLMIKKK